jgi:hypothetical protein
VWIAKVYWQFEWRRRTVRDVVTALVLVSVAVLVGPLMASGVSIAQPQVQRLRRQTCNHQSDSLHSDLLSHLAMILPNADADAMAFLSLPSTRPLRRPRLPRRRLLWRL